MIIIEDLNVTDIVVPISEDVAYLVESGGTAVTQVRITMKEKVVGTLIDGVTLIFADNNPSDDTITRDLGSWFDDGFAVGMNITVTGTTTNDGTFVITGLTEKVITTTDTLADQTTADGAVVGNIPDTDWFVHETVDSTNKYTVIEVSPTALRFVKTGGTGTVRAWVRT